MNLIEGVIEEAPLADFETFGDLDKEGSFRGDDLKAVRSEKWLTKVRTQFANFPHPLNVYVYNGEGGMVSIGSREIDARNFAMLRGELAGVQPPSRVQRILGKLPPNIETSITAILVENEGSERLPLTPWILAHRICHAVMEGGTARSQALRSPDLALAHTILIDDFNEAMRRVRTYLGAVDEFADLTLGMGGLTSEGVKDIARLVGTMRSARTGNLANGGEFLVEMMAQVMIQGRVTLKAPPFNDRDGYAPALQRRLDKVASQLTHTIEGMFGDCVGKIVLL